MATINLGRVKLVNRGTWSSANTYAIDDFVQYTDSGVLSTYIAVAASTNQVPSTSGTENASFWKFMSKGTAVNVGNNKVVASDGSGNLTGVSFGTAGQALKMNSSANGLEFGSGANIGQVSFSSSSGQTTVASGSNSYVDVSGCSITITPASASSRFYVTTSVQQYSSGNGGGYGQIRLVRGSTAIPFNPGNTHGSGNGSGDPYQFNTLICVDSPATTSAITYKTQVSSYTGGTTKTNSPTGSAANLMVMEILT